MRKNTFEWFRLDNAAKIFPGQNTNTWSNVFRFGVELKEPVDTQILEVALERTLKRIPSFNVRMRNGFFWHYFERNPNKPIISPDINNPCYRIKFKENNGFLFRTYYHGNRICVDVYHSLCDGYGAVIFVSTLAAEYLRLKGHTISYNNFVLDVNEAPKEEELEDSYSKYASSKAKYNRKDKWVYHAKGTRCPRHQNNYITGIMSFKQVYAVAKSYGVTVTEFFAALLIDILYHKQLRENKKQREISAQIPVNLRKAFPSVTLRNFVLCLRVKINPQLGDYTFEEILRSVSLQLRLANDPKLINSLMTQNMKIERNFFGKYAPLILKDFGVGIGFLITGEQTTSTLLSNVGLVKLPEEMYEHIEKYIFYTGAGKLNGSRCGVMSVGDDLLFSFSSCYEDMDIQREFYTRLVKMGVHVKIESNKD